MKIAILGPAYPYRGGIAQGINSFICSLVNQSHTVTLFSFSRQYPNWFFPGKNQFESANTSNPFENLDLFYEKRILSTINPISWYYTYLGVLKSGSSVCFIRYWHPFFVPCLYIICFLLRRKKIQVICIIDNLVPHERYIGDIFLVKLLFSQIDKAITQSDIVHKQFSRFFPKKVEKMIPLPIYNQFGMPVDKLLARKYLKIPSNDRVLLFFGFIRPYKGLDVLLQSLPRVVESLPDISLYIVGECFGDFSPYQKIIDQLGLADIIHKYLSYIPSEDVRYWLGSCDLLVMPYKTVTNSAVNSAGLYYSENSLLTVGISHLELSEKIIYELTHSKKKKKKPITWEDFTESALNFI